VSEEEDFSIAPEQVVRGVPGAPHGARANRRSPGRGDIVRGRHVLAWFSWPGNVARAAVAFGCLVLVVSIVELLFGEPRLFGEGLVVAALWYFLGIWWLSRGRRNGAWADGA
jgi:hypothetical protein